MKATFRINIDEGTIEISAPRGIGEADLLDAATRAHETDRRLRAVDRALETGKKGDLKAKDYADLMGRQAFALRSHGYNWPPIARKLLAKKDVNKNDLIQVKRWPARWRHSNDADYDDSDWRPPEGGQTRL